MYNSSQLIPVDETFRLQIALNTQFEKVFSSLASV